MAFNVEGIFVEKDLKILLHKFLSSSISLYQ